MPIEKIEHVAYKAGDNIRYFDSLLLSKLNELIDSLNTISDEQSLHCETLDKHTDKFRMLESDASHNRSMLNILKNKIEDHIDDHNELKQTDDDIEIRGCPWCGSTDIEFFNFGFPGQESYRGDCQNCQAHNSPRSTKQEAIRAWNTRT